MVAAPTLVPIIIAPWGVVSRHFLVIESAEERSLKNGFVGTCDRKGGMRRRVD